MARDSNYKTGTWTIPANGTVDIGRDAHFLICLEADAPFKLRFDQGTINDFEKGVKIRTIAGFRRIEMRNETGVAISVKLGFGYGDVDDARLNVSGSFDAEVARPDVFKGYTPISAVVSVTTALVAANLKRNELLLVNTGTVAVWITDNAAAAAPHGTKLAAGQSLTLTSTAAVYVYNPSGTDAPDISVTELEFS